MKPRSFCVLKYIDDPITTISKMYKFILFIILIFLSVLQSCSEDELTLPPLNELECVSGLTDFDTVKLDPISIGFVSYTGNETIVFKNDLGHEVKFEPLYGALKHSYHNDEFELQCTSGDTNYYEFNRDQFAVSKKCEALNLQFYLNVFTQYSYSMPLFYDLFSLLLHSPPLDHIIDTAISISIVTSLKGNAELLDLHPNFTDTYNFTADTTLLQVNFQNVYFSNNSTITLLPSLFFTKELGMVAFQDLDDVLWVFDRIE